MMPDAIHYRRLPGRRRGWFVGSSVWMAADHLLLVRSLRFREEYKRYQFGDIQAIVMAKAPRFHISTRALMIAVLWFAAYLVAKMFAIRGPIAALDPRFDWTVPLWLIAFGLVVAWVAVSGLFSCRCRVYTAVSRDELPSLYRVWTAEKFLRQVKPLIEQAQGAIQGEWVQAVENRYIGPAESVPPPPMPGMAGGPPQRRARSWASDALIGSLFADALLNAFNPQNAAGWVQAGNSLVTLLELGAAIVVMIQHYRGLLRNGMQRLAIVTVAAMGVFFYVQQFALGIAIGAKAAAHQPVPLALPVKQLFRHADAAITGLLGLAGLAIMLLSRDQEDRANIIYPST